MALPDETTWLEARITATEALITAYEDAILALSSGAALSYTIDTGQTRQTVTKQQIASLRATLDGLENRRATLRARRYGSGTRPVPGW
jgi:hypothetical protein